jgi:DNA-binding transcriptional LysR family regulator
MALVASPRYLQRHGTPRGLTELSQHNLISFNFERIRDGWPFRENGRMVSFPAAGNVQVGDGETARQLALAGVGITRLAVFHIGPDLKAGRLKTVLEPLNPGDTEAIHAVFIGQGAHLPARIRAFIDFLAEHVKIR